MAAFRARSFGLGFARVCADGAVGFDFCASCSVTLMLDVCSAGVSDSTSCCPVCFGGRVSLTCGIAPAIDVSGIPVFRGGGGWVSKEYGWYAVLVCIFRFEHIREEFVEEKDRRTCWQGRREDVPGEEANLKTMLVDDVKGARTRCTDILAVVCGFWIARARPRRGETWL
jgi:hypothetical protein